MTPRRPRALGGGPGEGRAKKLPTPMGAALCTAVGGVERKLSKRFNGPGGRRGDGGHQPSPRYAPALLPIAARLHRLISGRSALL